jgi:arginyl-tRNA synthetase
VIPGDLDAELALQVRAIAPGIPARSLPAPGASWRPATGDPASYATSLPFELSRRTGRPPAELAAALAAGLIQVPWIAAAAPTGDGYITITVTGLTLASVAGRMAAAGPACGHSDLLAGTAVVVPPWPDLGFARTWRQAWDDQASAMTARLAAAAGASVTRRLSGERAGSGVELPREDRPGPKLPGGDRPGPGLPGGDRPVPRGELPGGERAAPRGPALDSARSTVQAAAEYFGVDEIRYELARTLPGHVGRLATGAAAAPGHYAVVQLAHAEAASVLRWAGELHMLERGPTGEFWSASDRTRTPQSDSGLAGLLASGAERELLGLLSWFPLRIAAAARRQRAAEVPHYLEQVCAAWTASRLAGPALPFGGAAASPDPAVAAARLVLADAVRAVLAAGLALAGIGASDRI